MSSDLTMRLTNVNRRRFLGAVATASVAGIAGCADDGNSDGPDPEETDTETETETEESTSECTSSIEDCTREFAQTVVSEIEDSGDTPEPIEGGLHIGSDGESIPAEAALLAGFDLTNESTLGRQMGNLVFGPIYENWPDYPETEAFYIGVSPANDPEDRRTIMNVKQWWIEGLRDGNFTVDEVTNNVLDTSTEPLHEVTGE